MTNYVFINEQHKLLPEQEHILKGEFLDGYEIVKVPSDGWTSGMILDQITDRSADSVFIFISPIPLMIGFSVLFKIPIVIMHNDKREKKEINGKIISVVAQTGWQLIWIK